MKKPVVFTDHAIARLKQRSGALKYAQQIFQKATLVYRSKRADYYRNGRFRFVAHETEKEITVVTVIAD